MCRDLYIHINSGVASIGLGGLSPLSPQICVVRPICTAPISDEVCV